jgi:hypothetical protein
MVQFDVLFVVPHRLDDSSFFLGWELQCLQPHSSEHELKVLSVLLFGLIIFVEPREHQINTDSCAQWI